MYVTFDHNFDEDEASFLRRLAKTNGFSESDIQENKTGRLSTPQLMRLAFSALAPFVGMIAAAGGLVVIAILLYVAGPVILSRFRLLMALSKYLVIGAGALFFGLVAFLVKFGVATGRILSLVRDMLEGKVSSVNGRLTTSKADQVEDGINRLTNQSTQTYSYVVKNEYFEVSQEAYEAMDGHTGANFRLYVTPRSRYLVALEASVAEPGTGRDAFKLEYKDPS